MNGAGRTSFRWLLVPDGFSIPHYSPDNTSPSTFAREEDTVSRTLELRRLFDARFAELNPGPVLPVLSTHPIYLDSSMVIRLQRRGGRQAWVCGDGRGAHAGKHVDA